MDLISVDLVSIMDFPPEIREKIWNKLETRSALTCRLVSQAFRMDVENLYTFKVEITTRTNELYVPKLLDFRVGHLSITDVSKLSDIQLETINPPSRSSLLKHPEFLKSLHIDRFHAELNHGSYSKVLNLIQSTTPFLAHLSLVLSGHEDKTLALPEPLDLQNLESLKLDLRSLRRNREIWDAGDFDQIGQEHVPSFVSQLLRASMPNVKSFEIVYADPTMFSFEHLPWISRHSRSLRYISIRGIQPFRHQLNINELNFSGLTDLKRLALWEPHPSIVKIFLETILNQKVLEKLDLRLVSFSINHQGFYSQIILPNSSTLVEIRIHDVPSWNCTLFATCPHLKALKLHRSSHEHGNVPDLLNLLSLPQRLEKLELRYYKILSSELESFVQSNRAGSLRSLILNIAGRSGLFGVTESVIDSVLTLEAGHLRRFVLEGINYPKGPEGQRIRDRLVEMHEAGRFQYDTLDPWTIVMSIGEPPYSDGTLRGDIF